MSVTRSRSWTAKCRGLSRRQYNATNPEGRQPSGGEGQLFLATVASGVEKMGQEVDVCKVPVKRRSRAGWPKRGRQGEGAGTLEDHRGVFGTRVGWQERAGQRTGGRLTRRQGCEVLVLPHLGLRSLVFSTEFCPCLVSKAKNLAKTKAYDKPKTLTPSNWPFRSAGPSK